MTVLGSPSTVSTVLKQNHRPRLHTERTYIFSKYFRFHARFLTLLKK